MPHKKNLSVKSIESNKKLEIKNQNRFNAFNLLIDSDNEDENYNKYMNGISKSKINKIKVQENETIIKKEDDSNDVNTNKNKYVPPSISNTGWTSIHNGKKKKEHNIKKEDMIELDLYDSNIELKGDNMGLNSKWTVWIHENSNDNWGLESYESIYTITNVGNMWRFLSVFDNLDKNIRQYYIMRDGITPIWEDINNKTGAICSIMIENMNRHNRHSRGDLGVDAFTAMCVLVLNESFVRNNLDVNGLCYSIKNRNVLIKLWLKNYEKNKNFTDKLPISILKKLDDIISLMDTKNSLYRNQGKSRVSVQIKQIKPNY